MQCTWIDRWKAIEQRDDPLAQLQRIAIEEHQRTSDRAVGDVCGGPDLVGVCAGSQRGFHRAGYVLAVLYHALSRADIGAEVRKGAESLLAELRPRK